MIISVGYPGGFMDMDLWIWIKNMVYFLEDQDKQIYNINIRNQFCFNFVCRNKIDQ